MADVVQRCIAANDVKNNNIVVAVNKNGVNQSKQRGYNYAPVLAEVESKLTDRYDYQVQ